MSEIQSLAAQAERLSQSVDWWNTAIILMMIVAAAAATGLVYTQSKAFNEAKRLVDIEKKLSKAKDREYDLKIADARNEASAADQRAGEANERAAVLEVTAENLRKENLSRQAEVLKLQERLAGRRITREQHDRFVAILSPFAGSVVRITQLGDLEAGTFADDIVGVLSSSRWVPQIMRVGIMAPPPYGLQCVIDDRTPAGKALTEVLKSLPTAVVKSAPVPDGIANVVVGLRPPP